MTNVNLDTSTAITLIAEGSPARHSLKAFAQGKILVMAEVAAQEFHGIVAIAAGPREQSRAQQLLNRITVIPNNPSARALRLTTTNALQPNDILILGTGDSLGITTMTADRKAVRAAEAQGVRFQVFLHPSFSLRGV